MGCPFLCIGTVAKAEARAVDEVEPALLSNPLSPVTQCGVRQGDGYTENSVQMRNHNFVGANSVGTGSLFNAVN